MQGEIINRVAKSGLITLDLEELHEGVELEVYDLKDNLWQGLALKEKEFREFVKNHNWSSYEAKNVVIGCSADAIIPKWAFMLLVLALKPFTSNIQYAENLDELEQLKWKFALQQLNVEDLEDARVVVKGCSSKAIPTWVYTDITNLLASKVKTLLYGEPCSTVPLFKKR